MIVVEKRVLKESGKLSNSKLVVIEPKLLKSSRSPDPSSSVLSLLSEGFCNSVEFSALS